jgi:ubiquinone/menaquinone biosynthesis C-methylase UbiE
MKVMKVHTMGLQELSIRNTTNDIEDRFLLDIGGGGEGIISKLLPNKNNIVSIDIRKNELLEVSNDSLKIVMDSREMKFLDNSFQTITCFFSLMYMDSETKEKTISEIYRVLKPKGLVHIWDTKVLNNHINQDCDAVVYDLQIELNDKYTIKTGYGIHSSENYLQTQDSVLKTGLSNGLLLEREEKYADSLFYLLLRK